MAILSASELEAVLTNVLLTIERVITERGSAPKLEGARDDLTRAMAVARVAPKLKALRPQLDKAADVVQAEIPDDGKLLDSMWDILDYVDYRT